MSGPHDETRDLEHRLSEWLHAERVEQPPAWLRRRLLAIPQAGTGTTRWFAVGPLAIAATVALAVVLSVAGVTLLRPALPGASTATCDDPRAVLQGALAELHEVDGFRWTEHHQEWTWDPEVEPSLENPRYAWSGYRAEGSHLAPDRTYWVVTEHEREFSRGHHGYVEQVRIGTDSWARSFTFDPATPPRWHDLHGGLVVPPPLTDFRPGDAEQYGQVQLSREVPGRGGCLVTGWVPDVQPTDGEWIGHGGEFRFGIRIEEGSVVAALTEVVHSPELQPGDTRTAIELRYDVPAASEFAPPDGPIPPVPPAGFTPDCEEPLDRIEDAMRQLERTLGYYWSQHHQRWDLDPEHPPSVENPRYAWSGHRAEGAYMAPDLMRVRLIEQEREAPVPGVFGVFLEGIKVRDQAWGRSPDHATPPGWQELPYDVEANQVYVNLDFLVWASEQVRLEPAELTQPVPGEGGCLVTGRLEGDDGDGAVQPGAVLSFGLRIDHQARITGAVVERRHHPEPEHGDLRIAYEVWYTLPHVEEFQPPEGPIHTYPPEP